MSRLIPEIISRMIPEERPVNERVEGEQRQQRRGKKKKQKRRREKRKIKRRTNRGINYLDYARAKRGPTVAVSPANSNCISRPGKGRGEAQLGRARGEEENDRNTGTGRIGGDSIDSQSE